MKSFFLALLILLSLKPYSVTADFRSFFEAPLSHISSYFSQGKEDEKYLKIQEKMNERFNEIGDEIKSYEAIVRALETNHKQKESFRKIHFGEKIHQDELEKELEALEKEGFRDKSSMIKSNEEKIVEALSVEFPDIDKSKVQQLFEYAVKEVEMNDCIILNKIPEGLITQLKKEFPAFSKQEWSSLQEETWSDEVRVIQDDVSKVVNALNQAYPQIHVDQIKKLYNHSLAEMENKRFIMKNEIPETLRSALRKKIDSVTKGPLFMVFDKMKSKVVSTSKTRKLYQLLLSEKLCDLRIGLLTLQKMQKQSDYEQNIEEQSAIADLKSGTQTRSLEAIEASLKGIDFSEEEWALIKHRVAERSSH